MFATQALAKLKKEAVSMRGQAKVPYSEGIKGSHETSCWVYEATTKALVALPASTRFRELGRAGFLKIEW